MTERFVLDASALLCLLKGEQGAERVVSVLARAVVSAVNLSEVYGKLADAGGSEDRIAQAIGGLYLRVEPFDDEQARRAGMLQPLDRLGRPPRSDRGRRRTRPDDAGLCSGRSPSRPGRRGWRTDRSYPGDDSHGSGALAGRSASAARGRARQRLDLRLLVDAQHHATMRRSQVQANDVPDLVDEGGIGRELEGVGLVRLEPEGAPDPRDHALAHAHPPSHGAGRPVGGVLRLAFQREGDQPFDGRVRDGMWRTRAGQVDEAVEAMGKEAGTPHRDAHPADAEITGNATVSRSRLGAGQQDTRALSQGLTDTATANEPRQARALVLGQMQRSRF